jgi:hypothetical protein
VASTTPPPLRPLHSQVIRKAYPPSGSSRDTGRNGRRKSGFCGIVKDIRRLQAVNGNSFRRTLNVDVVCLITHVDDPVTADIRGLEGSPGDTMP